MVEIHLTGDQINLKLPRGINYVFRKPINMNKLILYNGCD